MYRAPLEDITFTLKNVTGLAQLQSTATELDISDDLVEAILGEAAKFAEEEIADLNKVGDTHGAKLVDGSVQTAPGWKEAYAKWVAAGWNGLTGPEDFGGQSLPTMLHVAVLEMLNSASMSFALGPTLTTGAVEALEKHGSEELKNLYLEKLVTGEWTGTMNLTEPQAGSDLNELRAKAVPQGDGTYKISGQKIFISYGDHDMADNIIHMVLARLPDAPAGTRGISLFLVPKFLINEDGSIGELNDVSVAGLEHKMGIHASPTCTMSYGDNGGAIGWLVGEENRGLACMFTMMNNARLAVGVQGIGIAERAFQQALSFSLERKQGRAKTAEGVALAPIAAHPDVKRMLMSMKAQTQVCRVLCYACAHALDMQRYAKTEEERSFWADRAAMLTPIAKALPTDMGVDVASLGIQVHGGMGFIEETGAAQYMRDARIAPIYEGTNGIQSIDLVMRKLPLGGGDHVEGLIAEIAEIAESASASNEISLGSAPHRLHAAIEDLREATAWMKAALEAGEADKALASATPYLRLFGLTLGAGLLVKGALAAKDGTSNADKQRGLTARVFAETTLSETSALKTTVVGAADGILAIEPEMMA
ncbi:acyl-CoA dehydrogenase [Rhodobacteraceae bacterium RKSG542]|uniref:acyl-CoA dehydrogenase n=1 Tax=Pseudovibrio flavus TaxID=2529854 RepID=UPI0012BD2D9F|nr:acyl-CoA dehydrogenase [Pseudovibrio flavus]MTI18742.1 acyl-CoA dehydrogenase [Pseudovibrio flavus]